MKLAELKRYKKMALSVVATVGLLAAFSSNWTDIGLPVPASRTYVTEHVAGITGEPIDQIASNTLQLLRKEISNNRRELRELESRRNRTAGDERRIDELRDAINEDTIRRCVVKNKRLKRANVKCGK